MQNNKRPLMLSDDKKITWCKMFDNLARLYFILLAIFEAVPQSHSPLCWLCQLRPYFGLKAL
ncbi:MAG: hypothetical protein KBT06_00195, partial [Prevotellaceae bacterium]|nr:hypothetical protein [Candidatus Colivivens equi]